MCVCVREREGERERGRPRQDGYLSLMSAWPTKQNGEHCKTTKMAGSKMAARVSPHDLFVLWSTWAQGEQRGVMWGLGLSEWCMFVFKTNSQFM